jgi:hypothetical protein
MQRLSPAVFSDRRRIGSSRRRVVADPGRLFCGSSRANRRLCDDDERRTPSTTVALRAEASGVGALTRLARLGKLPRARAATSAKTTDYRVWSGEKPVYRQRSRDNLSVERSRSGSAKRREELLWAPTCGSEVARSSRATPSVRTTSFMRHTSVQSSRGLKFDPIIKLSELGISDRLRDADVRP